jgi:allantoate deiminase
VDAAGNLRGVLPCADAARPRVLIGSHIDTVPNAGAFDGVLGVALAVALAQHLQQQPLTHAVEVIAFSEEEGVRFGVPFIGSRAVAGTLDAELLSKTDASGITVREAIQNFGLDPGELDRAALDVSTACYLEFHIEQGPVLESLGKPLGVVESIAGLTRILFRWTGAANHAGTTPMHLRKDALAGAAEWIALVEREARQTDGLVATVGRIEVKRGAANVIPGETVCSLDVRHADDRTRLAARDRLICAAHSIAAARGLVVNDESQLEQSAVPMDSRLVSALDRAAAGVGYQTPRMISGAGHDAMILAPIMPAAMLFLRSPGGISHHPDETVLPEDVEAALATGIRFFEELEGVV